MDGWMEMKIESWVDAECRCGERLDGYGVGDLCWKV